MKSIVLRESGTTVGKTLTPSGVAAALVVDAEARLADSGFETAWLACAIGNDRAARFYEKCGWRRVGNMINHLETTAGPMDLEVWRYEKQLS